MSCGFFKWLIYWAVKGVKSLKATVVWPGETERECRCVKGRSASPSCSCLNDGKSRVISLLSGEEVVSEDRDTAHLDTFKGTLKAELHLC